jgi:hypothetical protein
VNLLFNVLSIILPAHISSHIKSGSVSVLLPDPCDSADLDIISWSASEAGTNIDSSNSEDIGVKRDIRRGIKGVKSLFITVISIDKRKPS